MLKPYDEGEVLRIDSIVYSLDGDIDYLKFLIAEQPYIRSAMLATSPPTDPEEWTGRYPTTIGNALHCDLIELEAWMETLAPNDRYILTEWANRQKAKPYFAAAKIRRVKHLIGKFPQARRGRKNRNEE
jgi:hypothetical protein